MEQVQASKRAIQDAFEHFMKQISYHEETLLAQLNLARAESERLERERQTWQEQTKLVEEQRKEAEANVRETRELLEAAKSMKAAPVADRTEAAPPLRKSPPEPELVQEVVYHPARGLGSLPVDTVLPFSCDPREDRANGEVPKKPAPERPTFKAPPKLLGEQANAKPAPAFMSPPGLPQVAPPPSKLLHPEEAKPPPPGPPDGGGERYANDLPTREPPAPEPERRNYKAPPGPEQGYARPPQMKSPPHQTPWQPQPAPRYKSPPEPVPKSKPPDLPDGC